MRSVKPQRTVKLFGSFGEVGGGGRDGYVDPVIGSASDLAPPLPWPNRAAVLRRAAEIQALREGMRRNRASA